MSDTATTDAPAGTSSTTSTLLGSAATTPEGATTDATTSATADGAAVDGTGSTTEAVTPPAPITYTFTAPEGTELDPAMVEAATPLFQSLNAPPEVAQQLVTLAATHVHAAVQAVHDARVAEVQGWREATERDADIGGAKLAATIADADRLLQAVPNGPALRAALDETGLGNHPEVIRALAHLGRALAEDTAVRGGSGGTTTLSAAERLYPTMRQE
jgi:hypothetical protein